MKILFVLPSMLDIKEKPIKRKKGMFPPLILSVLNGMTPDTHSVELIDDLVEEPDYSKDYDLVGISLLSVNAPRGYQIADAFRSKGVKVILGGIHASVMPDEAKLHADSIVIGEVDNIWGGILDDCENDNLKEFYKADSFPDLGDTALQNWDKVKLEKYSKIGKMPLMPLFTSRGCPMGCSFCAVSKFFGKIYRTKPVPRVIKEIDMADADYYYFNDDNIAFKPDYSRELFKALIPKNIKWASQISTAIVKQPDLIDLAGKSGCMELLIGFETVNPDNLKAVNKSFNKIEYYEELIERIHKAGISVVASFIIGFDEDSADEIGVITDFVKKNKITRPTISILTPLPGTKLFEQMEEQGRMENYNWSRYSNSHLVFKSKIFSADQLRKDVYNFYTKRYSYKNLITTSWFTARKIRPQRPVYEFCSNFMMGYLYKKMLCHWFKKL